MSQDYKDSAELQDQVKDYGKKIETLGEEQQEHQEDMESFQAKLRILKSGKGVYNDSDSDLQQCVESAIEARETSVETCKGKIGEVKVQMESKLENLKQSIEKTKERTTHMEQVAESLKHKSDGVVNNIEINIQQHKDDIADATDKAGSIQDIISMAAQLATTASVGASLIGQIVRGLQSMGLFR
jgi:DNA polymerase II small subunit/DNA polymerase delta subunit B